MVPTPVYTLALWIERITPIHFALGVLIYATVLFKLGYVGSAITSLLVLLLVYGVIYTLKITARVQRRSDGLIKTAHSDRAFPSGHAGASAMLIPLLWFTAPWQAPTLTVVCTVLVAILVSLSRLVLKVHTPTQVVAGFLLGLLLPFLVFIYLGPVVVELLLTYMI